MTLLELWVEAGLSIDGVVLVGIDHVLVSVLGVVVVRHSLAAHVLRGLAHWHSRDRLSVHIEALGRCWVSLHGRHLVVALGRHWASAIGVLLGGHVPVGVSVGVRRAAWGHHSLSVGARRGHHSLVSFLSIVTFVGVLLVGWELLGRTAGQVLGGRGSPLVFTLFLASGVGLTTIIRVGVLPVQVLLVGTSSRPRGIWRSRSPSLLLVVALLGRVSTLLVGILVRIQVIRGSSSLGRHSRGIKTPLTALTGWSRGHLSPSIGLLGGMTSWLLVGVLRITHIVEIWVDRLVGPSSRIWSLTRVVGFSLGMSRRIEGRTYFKNAFLGGIGGIGHLLLLLLLKLLLRLLHLLLLLLLNLLLMLLVLHLLFLAVFLRGYCFPILLGFPRLLRGVFFLIIILIE